jgi:hypothetical protein
MKGRIIIFLMLALSGGLPVQGDEQAPMARLLSGEIIVANSDEYPEGGAARASALMHAPTEQIWNTLLSCEHARVYVPKMQHCKVLELDDAHGKIYHVIDQPWPLPALDIVFESRFHPFRTIESRLVAGNLSDFHATWHFREMPRGVLVDYVVYIEPAFPVPRFLVRRYFRKQLPDMLACLRALSHASGSTGQQQKDRARCRGEAH